MDANGFGYLTTFSPTVLWAAGVLAGLTLGFVGAPAIAWAAVVAAAMWGLGASASAWWAFAAIATVACVPQVRRWVLAWPVMKTLSALKLMPVISETERIALEAGSIWVDGELFSGKPNFHKIRGELYPRLNAEEQQFLDGPVNELCQMTDDWEVFQNGDLSSETWQFMKDQRFLGMVIPKEYGGLGFSALCHSEVVQRLTSRSIPLSVSVMVPNSLGPGELILHYGTQEQKDHYLPRLAKGEEIPCFALTEPKAGSDAGSMQSSGEVFRGEDGNLYVRLNWNKRYITLAAISTIIGLAIKLRDPENLLGKGEDLGITCMLIPAHTKGVVLGQRHNPMGVPFFNCPTRGENVVVSVDQIIGGAEGAGQGWRMLMECLAAGRAISLPAQSTGSAKLVTRVTSAYALIREQFGLSIGRFEGIEDLLARIGGTTYLLEAMRRFTAGAVDQGKKPAVISAIAKYNATELSRKMVVHGMDILGGAGISRGPRNLLAHTYIGAPIGITVEGANILTRSMIVFGQGAIRCHPFAYREMQALQTGNLAEFDRAFFGHIGHVFRNGCRALLLTLTRGHLARVPMGVNRKYYRKLAWTSASFAFFADVAMGTLGGSLKFREHITGRFADILSWMYLGTATLRRFEADGKQKSHKVFLDYAMAQSLSEIQKGFEGLFQNFDIPVLGFIFRGPVSFWNRLNRLSAPPRDVQSHKLVQSMMKASGSRQMLSDGIFIPNNPEEMLRKYEDTFQILHEAQVVFNRLKSAVRRGELPKKLPAQKLVAVAYEKGMLTDTEATLLKKAAAMRDDAIEVDSFRVEEFRVALMDTASETAKAS